MRHTRRSKHLNQSRVRAGKGSKRESTVATGLFFFLIGRMFVLVPCSTHTRACFKVLEGKVLGYAVLELLDPEYLVAR